MDARSPVGSDKSVVMSRNWIPGLGWSGIVLIVPILAGLGLAGLVRLVPEERRGVAQGIAIAVIWTGVVIGPQVGRHAGLSFAPLRVAPSAELLARYLGLGPAGAARYASKPLNQALTLALRGTRFCDDLPHTLIQRSLELVAV